jgi:hypothetical protein
MSGASSIVFEREIEWSLPNTTSEYKVVNTLSEYDVRTRRGRIPELIRARKRAQLPTLARSSKTSGVVVRNWSPLFSATPYQYQYQGARPNDTGARRVASFRSFPIAVPTNWQRLTPQSFTEFMACSTTS